ncbi:ParA family protein [Paraburkholderia tropica]|uniref:ParA family protein n=1 Tax=Paraburkholderia tropica TaxID=92647 RepID=UPI002AB6F5AE|nr:ArsA-related P-loop ATPase [Paraburkholderia tropica]
MTIVRFNDALRSAVRALSTLDLPTDPKPRLVRDVFGRLRYALNCSVDAYPAKALAELQTVQASLGAFASSGEILTHDSFSFPDKVFADPDWRVTLVHLGYDEDGVSLGETTIMLLDRQITGQDWLRPKKAVQTASRPLRMVFFGLKGGVGRSTALCMTAWGLARKGKRVLLLDFDLESPGLSGLVLPPEKVAEFGVVDWLIEDAVGQGESVPTRMVAASPLGESTVGAIRVAAAIGQGETDYLAKLARAYADVPTSNGPERLGQRLLRLVETLEAQENPDVVLIDSRAGLHDLAAVAITCMADTALLFASDGAQSWSGYRQLFSHWQQRPEIATRVRERLTIVRALTPTSNREANVQRFQRRAYELFAETLYDEIPSTFDSTPTDQLSSLFHPGEADESAPHAPILIDWDEHFQEFDPMLRPEDGGATHARIEATFGTLIDFAYERAQEGSK